MEKMEICSNEIVIFKWQAADFKAKGVFHSNKPNFTSLLMFVLSVLAITKCKRATKNSPHVFPPFPLHTCCPMSRRKRRIVTTSSIITGCSRRIREHNLVSRSAVAARNRYCRCRKSGRRKMVGSGIRKRGY